ncbi:hypothetical protein ABG768_020943 [Culter alburnus]|uniref:C2 domain-containing protein n=1 Tax=Culter alburnus TaxID=194366 RepID=A0AAW2AUE5_CULAL
MHTTPDTSKVSHLYHYITPLDIISVTLFFWTAMAVFHDLRLMSLAMLMLASQLDFASAAVRVFGLNAKGLDGDFIGRSDTYVKVWCGSTYGGETEQHSSTNPTWSKQFNFPNCNTNDNLKLEVWDKDLVFDDLLGTCGRLVQNGSFTVTCYLNEGTLFYSYEAN